MGILSKAAGFYRGLSGQADRLEPVALLLARLALGAVFLRSGVKKWDGWFQFNPNSYDLFRYEYFCPEEVRAGALQLCSDHGEGLYTPLIGWLVDRFANLAGIMEIALPVLLFVGLLSRLSALGLLAMTLFIQVFVFPEWDAWWWVGHAWWGSHVMWAALALVIMARGPGLFSLDHVFGLDRASATKKGDP